MTSVHSRLRLKKELPSIQNLDFHKEKEMVDFRKWLLALAVVGLLLGVGTSTANAQGPAFTCAATAVPNIVRSEGVTELLGDLILNCTGGVPTGAGLPIPLQNVVITVGGTNVTSRIVDSTTLASEALLLIDEPYPADPTRQPNDVAAPPDVTNPPLVQSACVAANNTNCLIRSVGYGLGASGSYNGVPNEGSPGEHYNVFQGFQSGANSIAWSGVPIDAPGTAGTRIIRITNIRANASLLAPGASSLTPVTISESIFVNGYQIIALNQPSNGNVVGNIEQGLVGSVGSPYSAPASYQQCNSVNTYLNPAPPAPSIATDTGILVNATEGFPYSFKPQNYEQFVYAAEEGYYEGPGYPTDFPFVQDVLNFPYNSESGFTPDLSYGGFDETTGAEIGVADHGTQIQFAVKNLGAGVNLYAPSYVYLSGNYGPGSILGVAVLSGANVISNGFATYVPTVLSGSSVPPNCTYGVTGACIPLVQVPATSTGSTSLVYEIYYSNPSVVETLSASISVEYQSDTATNTPPVTTLAAPTTVTPGFYPISTVPTASAGPIPRFVPDTGAPTFFSITACTCNLLFPFVTNQAGFDTGIAIANTTDDPFMTVAQNGTVTLNYYGNTPGTTAGVAPYTTQAAVPAGTELVFTLSNGGGIPGGSTPSVVVPATAGFEGYIIAQANFQYCHGFAFISDVGAQKLAEGYLAISLDIPYFPSYAITSTGSGTAVAVPIGPTGLNRTGNGGENEGH
jgi:hypothetical protein